MKYLIPWTSLYHLIYGANNVFSYLGVLRLESNIIEYAQIYHAQVQGNVNEINFHFIMNMIANYKTTISSILISMKLHGKWNLFLPNTPNTQNIRLYGDRCDSLVLRCEVWFPISQMYRYAVFKPFKGIIISYLL